MELHWYRMIVKISQFLQQNNQNTNLKKQEYKLDKIFKKQVWAIKHFFKQVKSREVRSFL